MVAASVAVTNAASTTIPSGSATCTSPSKSTARCTSHRMIQPRSGATASTSYRGPSQHVTRSPVSSSTSRVSPSSSEPSAASMTPPGVLQSSYPPRRWLRTKSRRPSDSTRAPATSHSRTVSAMPSVWHAHGWRAVDRRTIRRRGDSGGAMDDVPASNGAGESGESGDSLVPAGLPSRGAYVLAFLSVVLAGAFGGIIGYGLVDIGCSGDCGLAVFAGLAVGALIGAVGVG